MKSIFCLRQTHTKCARKGGYAYHSVMTGEPVTEKGRCECDCHAPTCVHCGGLRRDHHYGVDGRGSGFTFQSSNLFCPGNATTYEVQK